MKLKERHSYVALVVLAAGLAWPAGCERAGTKAQSAPGEVNASLTRLADPASATGTLGDAPRVQPGKNGQTLDLAAINQSALDIESLRGSTSDAPVYFDNAGTKPKRGGQPIARGAATEAQSTDTFVPTADVTAANQAWASVIDPAPAGKPAEQAAASASPANAQATSTDAAPSASLANLAGDSRTGVPASEPARVGADTVLVELASSMARSMRSGGEGSVPASFGLASLGFFRPSLMSELEDQSSVFRAALSAEDVAALVGARGELIYRARAEAPAETAAPATGDASPASGPRLNVPTAALCTRVQSFGRYDPLPSDTFLAGQTIRAILYTEVDGFSNAEGTGGKRRVELGQSLALFADGDGLEVWRRPQKSIAETGRNIRRDFYLVQEIELPRTLSVGAYLLKVTVEDKLAKSVAETIIPIRVVADPTLLTARGE